MGESNQSFVFTRFYVDFLLTMTSAMISRTISFPLNSMLFHYQNNVEPLRFYNLGKVLCGVDLANGYQACLRSLYKGFGAKLLESSTKKSIKIICQPEVEKKLTSHVSPWLEPMLGKYERDIALAGISGAIIGGCLFPAYPFEHLLNYQRNDQGQNSMWQVLRDKNKYLLRGMSVAWTRSIVTSAIPFAVIEATKSEEHSELKALFLSPVINAVLTTPFDTILARMQDNQYLHETAMQSTKAIANQGLLQFCRGSGPTFFFKGVKHVLPILAANAVRDWYQGEGLDWLKNKL